MTTNHNAAAATRSGAAAAALLWGSLALLALNLRPALGVVPPLIERIDADLGLSGFEAGLLTTLPLLAMGAFAPVAAWSSRRWSAESVAFVGLVVIAAGSVVRLVDGLPSLMLGAAAVGAGITFVATVLPALIGVRLPGRGAWATGVTTFLLGAGAMAATALAVPLANAFDGWQQAVAVMAVPAMAAALLWGRPAFRGLHTTLKAAAPDRRIDPPMRRRPLAWVVAGAMAVQSLHFYVALAWVPATYRDTGLSEGNAGLLLSVMAGAASVGALVGPAVARRRDDPGAVFAVAVLAAAASSVVLGLTPGAVPVVTMLVLGLGLGAGFSGVLTLLVVLPARPAISSALTGMVFLIGYLGAAIFPALVGALADLTGGFALPWLLVAGLCLLQLLALGAFARWRRGSLA